MHRLNASVDTSGMCALEFFARKGDWHTTDYLPFIKTLEAWEIDSAHEAELRVNLPNSKILITDSFKQVDLCSNKYDLIVLDNPQYIFGASREYSEHFEALPACLKICADRCVIIFNVNHCPFDYTSKTDWQSRRSDFYGLEDASLLSMKFLSNFYVDYFQRHGYEVIDIFDEARDPAYLSYMVAVLEKL